MPLFDSSSLGLPHRDNDRAAVPSEQRRRLHPQGHHSASPTTAQEACRTDTASAAKQSPPADTMEGTYGTAFPPNASPMSPNTPTSASNGNGNGQYKTNVNRTKTRKWVEAKVQNYDGDDWGNEYDEEPEPEEPPLPPPPRATGFRQPGQGLSSASQPSSPALGPAQSTGPAGPSGMRGASGPPALHIQTQQPPIAAARPGPAETTSPFVSGPSSLGSATIEQIVSPQSANPAQGAAPTAYGAGQDYPQRVVSPSFDQRMSPAPQTAEPVPTRFPPRKSSMSQQDPAEVPDVARFSQASDRPNSSHSKPWVQDRPASPGGARSPGTPAKPLPFIRPADIYRRMEEEKERERRSMDSSRPSMDSIQGRGIERVASPVKPAPEPVQEQQQVVAPKDEAPKVEAPDIAEEESNEPPRPVSRRKSDYNYRGILAGAPGPVPRSTATVSDPSNHPPHHADIPTQSQRESAATQESSDDDRRFSTSPKLPDLARMSVFGADFFSGAPAFTSNAPPLPSIPDNSPLESTAKSPTQALAQDGAPAPSAPPEAESKAEHNDTPSKVEEPVSRVPKSNLLRPSLPGGWVSETVTTPGDGITPGITGPDSGGVSPVTESSMETDQSHGAGAAQDVTGGDSTTEPVEGRSGPRDVGLGLSQLPPLNTTTETVPPLKEPHFEPEEAASDPPPPPPKDSPRTQPTSPSPDTAASDIAPTAPLQPHKGDLSPQDFRPEAIQRISTMSTVTNSSPVKESDVLREEIIKTLSPVRSSELFLQVTPPITGDEFAGPAERNPGRESAYLDDVYGDYWSGNDKKPDTLAEEDEAVEAAQQTPVQGTTSVVAQPDTNIVPVPHQPEVAADRPEANRNRFSWELESEDINSNANKGIPPVTEPADVAQPPSDQTTPMSPAQRQSEVPQLTVETSAGSISHQVSQASTLPPRRESEVPEPPSPISVLTDRNAPPATVAAASPPPEGGRRMSLAEEKVLIQASSHPVSPTPPSEQHPALAETSRSSPRTGTPVSPVAPKADLMSFRQILDLPDTSDRITKYQETRQQFAGIDSGLQEWLVHMRTYIPEHAGASGSFNYPLSMGPPPGVDSQNYPAVAVPPGVQPYYQQYQQYLSASTTNLNSPTGGRPVGGLTGSSQFGSSDLRHSSAQVGAKGKELLKTAGKAGKGLWGKSKNKLRGTGDKDDSSPPSSPPLSPVITPVKEKAKDSSRNSFSIGFGNNRTTATTNTNISSNPTTTAPKNRRTSWGLASLGVRSSRTNAPAGAAPSPAQFAQTGVPSHPGHSGRPGLLGSLSSLTSSANRNAYPNTTTNPNNPNTTAAPSISSSSLPFQLPQPKRISPFNSNSFLSHGGSNPSSSPFPPPPPQAHQQTSSSSQALPPQKAYRASTGSAPILAQAQGQAPVPAVARRDSQPELVSPVSETFSRSTPAPASTAVAAPPTQLQLQSHSQSHLYQPLEDLNRSRDQDHHFHNASINTNLQVPRPISKHQPSWDPFTGTPLYEEEGFDLDDPTQKDPGAPLGSSTSHTGASATAASSAPIRTSIQSSIVADEAKNVRTDDRSDDWVIVSSQPRTSLSSSTPAQVRIDPSEHEPQAQAQPQQSQPRGAGQSMPPSQGPVTSANISGHTGQPLADSTSSPQRQSSFVGLPPIRRSSTFGLSLTKATEEEAVNEGNRSGSPAAKPLNASNMSQVAMNPQQSMSPRPGQPAQGYYMMQGPPGAPQGFAGQPGGVYYQHLGMQQHPQGPYATNVPPQNAQMAQRGMPGPSMSNAGQSQQQFRSGPQFLQQQLGMMPPPNMTPNGNPIQRLPPQGEGGWKLEESHLSEPLQSARHRSSPSNASASSPADQANYSFDKETGAPFASTSPPPTQTPIGQRPAEAMPPPAHVSRFGPGQQPRQQPQQGGQPLQDNFQQPAPQFAQQQNNMLRRTETNEFQPPQGQDESENKRNSGIFSGLRDRFGGNSRERRDSLTGPRFQGAGVTGDGVSEASIPTEDGQDRKKRQSGLFSLRGPAPGAENIPPPSRQGTASSFDQQGAPLEKKRTFFSKPSGLGGPELSRTSTSDSSLPAGAGGDGQPKKRFSALKNVFKNGPQQEQGQQQQAPPATSQSMQSSMQGQQPPQGFGPPGQPNMNGPPQMSGAAGGPPQTRPFTADIQGQGQGRRPSQQQGPPVSYVPPEADRGRRTSGGGFLSGILGKRSDSKSRDSRPQQGQMQPGQQYPGQMMMQQGQPGQSPMQQGQFQQYPVRFGPQGQPIGPQGPMGQPQFLGPGGRGQPLTPQQMQQMIMMQQQGQIPNQQRLMTPQQPSPGVSPITQAGSPLNQNPVIGSSAQRPGMLPQQSSQASIQAQQNLQRPTQPYPAQQARPAVQGQDGGAQIPPEQTSQLAQGPQTPAPQALDEQATPTPAGQSLQSEPLVADQRQPQLLSQQPLGGPIAQNRASQSSQSTTPQPSLQAPARKPVGSSPSPNANKQQPQQAPVQVTAQPNQRLSMASSLQQSPKLGSQGSPQLRRVSTPSAAQNAQSDGQMQPTAPGAQQSSLSSQSPSTSPAPQPGQQLPPPAMSPQPGMMQRPPGAQQLQQGPPGQPQFQQPGGPMGPGMQQQQQSGQQGPWIVSRASTQMSSISGPSQAGQQFMQRPPQNMQMMGAPPQEEHQSTFSKLLGKGRSSGQPTQGPGPQQQRPERQERSGKGLFSAFKRSSKQPEPSGQAPPGGPQYGPGQGPQRMQQNPQMMQQMQRPPNGMQQSQPQVPGQQMRPGPGPGPYAQYQDQRQSPPKPQGSQPIPGASLQQPTGFPQQGSQQGSQQAPQQGVQQGPRLGQGQLQQGQQQFAQQRPQMAQSPPGAAGPPRPMNQRVVSGQRPNEPQYAQVPIPAGYAPVHGEGMLMPSQYNIGRNPSYGQYPPQMMQQMYQQGYQQQPQWGPPGQMQQRQVSPGAPQGQQPLNPPQQAQQGIALQEEARVSPQPQQTQGQPVPPPTSSSPQPQGLAATPQATPGLSPVSSSPGQQPQPQFSSISPDSHGQRPQPDRITTDASQTSVVSQPIIQHPGSPQNYPLPESSTFSPINSAAGNLPNPPLPQSFAVVTQEPEYRAADDSTGLTVQRQVSAVSQVSSLQPSHQIHQEHTIANVISGGATNLPSQSSPHASSPSPQITPERKVSPEPHVQHSPMNLSVNVHAANTAQEENIYDATPRNSVPPAARQEPPADHVIESPSAEPASKFAGRPQDHSDTRSNLSARSEERPQDLAIETAPPTHDDIANGDPQRPPNGNGRPVQSSADIFEEMKRKQLLREQEEKIPVNPTEPDMYSAAAAAAKKKDEDDVPQMSATSYPGQEWNPYGGAEYEDWNE